MDINYLYRKKSFKEKKMSTKERYGTLVWKASCHLAKNFGPIISIGQVAEVAQVSNPTAKKYLDSLVELGHIERYILPNKMRIYTVVLERC
jgi:DNA-binding MarR family transcriptional regulator